VLANLLESAGVRVAGVMLQSAAMNYHTNCGMFNPGQVSCEGYIPSYAAVSSYHQNGSLPADFTSVLEGARAFAAGAYRSEVGAFIASGKPPAETAQVTPPEPQPRTEAAPPMTMPPVAPPPVTAMR